MTAGNSVSDDSEPLPLKEARQPASVEGAMLRRHPSPTPAFRGQAQAPELEEERGEWMQAVVPRMGYRMALSRPVLIISFREGAQPSS